MWIILDRNCDDTYDSETAYWKRALAADKCSMLYPDTVQHIRTKETLSPLNQHKEAYRLWVSRIENPAKDHGNLLNRRIWKKFLYPVRRWMSQPGGDLRMTCALIDDLHMEYYYREVDGWMREWYVYVPESVKANPDRKVPLVLAMHGYTCSGEIYSGNSGWHQVADEYGFIVVFPSAVHGCFAVKEENRAISKDITVLPAWNIYSNPEFPDELIFLNICWMI